MANGLLTRAAARAQRQAPIRRGQGGILGQVANAVVQPSSNVQRESNMAGLISRIRGQVSPTRVAREPVRSTVNRFGPDVNAFLPTGRAALRQGAFGRRSIRSAALPFNFSSLDPSRNLPVSGVAATLAGGQQNLTRTNMFMNMLNQTQQRSLQQQSINFEEVNRARQAERDRRFRNFTPEGRRQVRAQSRTARTSNSLGNRARQIIRGGDMGGRR